MAIKITGPGGPVQPPNIPTPKESKSQDLKSKSDLIANTLAGLEGAADEIKKKDKRDALKESDRKRKLKEFGLRAGIKANDDKQQATGKIVEHVLARNYDRGESGFQAMVRDITAYIREQDEVREKFDRHIEELQLELKK